MGHYIMHETEIASVHKTRETKVLQIAKLHILALLLTRRSLTRAGNWMVLGPEKHEIG